MAMRTFLHIARQRLTKVVTQRNITYSSAFLTISWYGWWSGNDAKFEERKKYQAAALAQFEMAAHNPAPCDYAGNLFQPNFKFPTKAEEDKWIDPETHPWLKVNFTTDPELYLQKLLDYCFAGNIKPDDVQGSFDVTNCNRTKWFHCPWQHASPVGREPIKGRQDKNTKCRRFRRMYTRKAKRYRIIACESKTSHANSGIFAGHY